MNLLWLLSLTIFALIFVCGTVVWLANCFDRRRKLQLVRLTSVIDASGNRRVLDAHHSIDPLSIQAIKDLTRHARKDLELSEVAMCKLFGIERFDGSKTYDAIVNAVYEGSGWPELIADYNLRRYGARWPANTRIAKSVV